MSWTYVDDEGEEVFDISRIPSEEWPRFLFDRKENPRNWETFLPGEITELSDPVAVLGSMEWLFLHFRDAVKPYSLRQVNNGIWGLWGMELWVWDIFWREGLPLESRLRAVRAMVVPYRDFLAGHPAEVMENCFFMWWHLIKESRDSSGCEDWETIRQAYFDTLVEILRIPDRRCQEAALHGLGHSSHPDRTQVVHSFIEHNMVQDRDALLWAGQCRDGTVM